MSAITHDRELTNEQLDREIARVSEGFCRWCPNQRLEPSDSHGTAMGGCRCCGYQFTVTTRDYDFEPEPVVGLTTTGWPKGVGGVDHVGRCGHVDDELFD